MIIFNNPIGSTFVATAVIALGMTFATSPVNAGAKKDLECVAPCIDSFEIEDGEVSTNDLADDAVTSAKIADDAVGTSEIADGSVIEAKLAFDLAPLARVVFLSGDDTPTNNGTALLAAIGDIGIAAAPAP